MKRRFLIVLELEGDSLPIEARAASALEYSTAREAIATALDCECRMWIAAPEELEAIEL